MRDCTCRTHTWVVWDMGVLRVSRKFPGKVAGQPESHKPNRVSASAACHIAEKYPQSEKYIFTVKFTQSGLFNQMLYFMGSSNR